MSKYRLLQTSFWKDSFVEELTPQEKYFYIYLLTNESTTQCGIYAFRIKYVQLDLGYDHDVIEGLLNKFIEYGKIKYCSETKEIMIVNWLKYNFASNNPVMSCINKELKEVKCTAFIEDAYLICKSKGYPLEKLYKGINLACIGPIGPSDDGKTLLWEKEKEEEIKEEAEKEAKAAAETAVSINNNNSITAVLKVFNNNIHMITPLENEKLRDWCEDVEPEVVIAAIEEAVKYDVRTMAYIERILNNWLSKGITTIQGVNACLRTFNKKKAARKDEADIPNSKAYKLFEDGEDQWQ